MKILENYSLKNWNTFQVEANARYFVEADHLDALEESLQFAQNQKLPVLVLGGGSNVLLTQDFEGLVIANRLKGISEEIIDEEWVLVTAKAAENWHQFVLYTLSKNYGGLENLSLIPGNVGTSPMQNIGAYGVEIKDSFHECKALNINTFEIETFSKEKCKFGYRESFFKREAKGQYILLEVSFRLKRKNHLLKTEYGAISNELEKMNIQNPTIQDISQAVIAIRQSKLPDPKVTGNAGSFFKNPTIPLAQFEKLKSEFPNIQGYPNSDSVKVPAGWLIEQCGWKGKTIGNVGCHPLQALVIINATGKATGKEIYDFSTQIIQSVEEKFGISLEREVNIV